MSSEDSSKKRFAPKVPTTRLRQDDAVKLGTMSTRLEEQRQQREIQQAQKKQHHKARDGIITADSGIPSGPFALGPAVSLKNNSRQPSSFPSTLSSSRNNTPHPSLNNDDDVKPVLDIKEYCSGNDRYPVVLQPKKTLFGNEPFFRTGQFTLLTLPLEMPLVGTAQTPQENNINSTSTEEQVIDLDAANKAAATPECSPKVNGPFPPPWPLDTQGRLGKLRRFASGRMVLSVGPYEYEVRPSIGSDASVLYAVDAEYGQSFGLGPVQHFLQAVPDLSHLLRQINLV